VLGAPDERTKDIIVVNLDGGNRGMGSPPPLVARHRCERDRSAIGKYTAVTAQGICPDTWSRYSGGDGREGPVGK